MDVQLIADALFITAMLVFARQDHLIVPVSYTTQYIAFVTSQPVMLVNEM